MGWRQLAWPDYHTVHLCAAVYVVRETGVVCARSGDGEWLRTDIFFVLLSQLSAQIRPWCKRIQNVPFPNSTVHFVCGNSLHALRFRCERLIAYGYYGACACAGITVIISGVHRKSKGSLRFRGCHLLRILLSHNLELPHPQIRFCFPAERVHKLIFRHSY